MTPSVSVIVLAHRGSSKLNAALASVVAQDHRPLEIVVFENGTPVGPLDLPADLDLRLVRGGSPRNLGVAAGRKIGPACDILVTL